MSFYSKKKHSTLEDQIALYSKENFSVGEVVFDVSNLPIIHKNYKYAITLDHTKSLYIETKDSDVMYINHSCQPTLRFDKSKLLFVACQDIKDGDMLTFDYTTTEVNITSPFYCVCGYDNCKQMIGRISQDSIIV